MQTILDGTLLIMSGSGIATNSAILTGKGTAAQQHPLQLNHILVILKQLLLIRGARYFLFWRRPHCQLNFCKEMLEMTSTTLILI